MIQRIRLSPAPTATVIRLLTSLSLALLLWGWVTTQRDPTEQKTVANVAIAPPDLPSPLIIVGDLGQVSVDVEGPRSQITRVSSADLSPELDTRQIDGPGTYSLPIDVNGTGAVDVVRITPPRLDILVDRRETATFAIAALRPQEPGENRRIGNVTLTPSDATISGPASVVDRIMRVVAPIDLGDRTSTFSAEVDLQAMNQQGEVMTDIDIRPATTTLAVELTVPGKSVAVLPQTAGDPSDGYEILDRAVNPSAVVVDGPDDALADVLAVTTEQVDIEGATGVVTKRVAITGLPPAVKVIDPPSGMVDVVIDIRQRGVQQELPPQEVAVVGLAPGVTAILDPQTIAVVVIASEDALASLRAGDVVPRVDLSNLGPGTYDLAPSVAVPRGVQWIRTTPANVHVMITDLNAVGTVTSGPRPTSTPLPRP
jgi:YbbR domain-containing protein